MTTPAQHQQPASSLSRRSTLAALASSALPAGMQAGTQAGAQTPSFAQRPITLLVPFGPGGIADLTARAVARAMQATLGQAIVVDNRPGAGSIVASQAVAHATPDGHTLLLMSNGHAVAPSLFKKLPFDAQADFAPICLLARFDLALFVSATSRFKTLGDLLQHARSQPGKLTLGSVAVGSTQHLAALWLKQLAGIDVLVVPYKATPAVLGALRGGEIDAAFEIVGPWLPQLGPAGTASSTASPGVLRALAVGSSQRFAGLPQVPTMAEAGGPTLQRFDVASWNALAAPARTPPAVLAQLNQAANQALAQPEVQRQLRALGVRAQGGTPDQLRQWLAGEIRHWAEVVRAAGLSPAD